MAQEKKTLARPYAEAAFQLAQQRGRLAPWSEMLGLTAAVAADGRVVAAVGNPRVGRDELVELFTGLGGSKQDQDGINFIRLLVENDRLVLLPDISELFDLLKADAEGTIEAEVVSAFEVSDAQAKSFAAALKKKFGREVTLLTRVDKSLLGGIVIRAGDVVIDGSVRGRLQDLSSQFNQ